MTSPVVRTSLCLDCKSLRFALNRSNKKKPHKPLDTRLCPCSGMLWEPPFKTSSLYLFSSAASNEEGKITPCLNSRPRRVLWVAHLCVSLWMQKRTRPCPLVCAVLLSLDSQGKLLQWSIRWWCGPVKVFGGLDQKLRFWDLFLHFPLDLLNSRWKFGTRSSDVAHCDSFKCRSCALRYCGAGSAVGKLCVAIYKFWFT